MEQNSIQTDSDQEIFIPSAEEGMGPEEVEAYNLRTIKDLQKKISATRIQFIEKEISLLEQELATTPSVTLSETNVTPPQQYPVRSANKNTLAKTPAGPDEINHLIAKKRNELSRLRQEVDSEGMQFGSIKQMQGHLAYLETTLGRLGAPRKIKIGEKESQDSEDDAPTDVVRAFAVTDQNGQPTTIFDPSIIYSEEADIKENNPETMEKLRKDGIFDARTDTVAKELAQLQAKLLGLQKKSKEYSRLKKFATFLIGTASQKQESKKNTSEILADIKNTKIKIRRAKERLYALHDAGFVEFFSDMSDDEIQKKIELLEQRENEEFARHSTDEAGYRNTRNTLNLRKMQRNELREKGGAFIDALGERKDLSEQEIIDMADAYSDELQAKNPIINETDEEMGKNYFDGIYGPVRIFEQNTGKDAFESDFVMRAKESQEFLHKVLAERAAERLATQKPEIKVSQPLGKEVILFTKVHEIQARYATFVEKYPANDSNARDPQYGRLAILDNLIKNIAAELTETLEQVTNLEKVSKSFAQDVRFNSSLTKSEIELKNKELDEQTQSLAATTERLVQKLHSTIALQDDAIKQETALQDGTGERGAFDFEREQRKAS